MASKTTTTKDIAVKSITDSDLAAIDSFADLQRLFAEKGIAVEAASEYGTGFTLLKDKARLVGVTFAIVEWKYVDSDKYTDEHGNPNTFVVVELVTINNEKYVITDGGVGIKDQLKMIDQQRTAKGVAQPRAGLLVNGGLVRSEYVNADGVPGETFYLNV